jgi:hypothetical protein
MESGGAMPERPPSKSPIISSTGESASLPMGQGGLDNKIIEKFFYCKMKIIEKADGKEMVRKNFWVFPPVDSDKISKEEQGEADILSGFCFQKMWATSHAIETPVAYIAEFFAKFRSNNARKFWFVLNQNMKQQLYVNEYNPGGVRNFFGMSFDDFEFAHETNSLVNTQSLLLFESKYPFRTFMFRMLEIIFDLVRVHRLSQYSMNFNGDTRDLSNLTSCSLYDSSHMVQVIQQQSTQFLNKLLLEQGDRQIIVSEDQYLQIKQSFKPDPMMADFYEAVESKFGSSRLSNDHSAS